MNQYNEFKDKIFQAHTLLLNASRDTSKVYKIDWNFYWDLKDVIDELEDLLNRLK